MDKYKYIYELSKQSKIFINLIILTFTVFNWLQKALYWYDNLELFKNILI